MPNMWVITSCEFHAQLTLLLFAYRPGCTGSLCVWLSRRMEVELQAGSRHPEKVDLVKFLEDEETHLFACTYMKVVYE